jgi:hypothetical protein
LQGRRPSGKVRIAAGETTVFSFAERIAMAGRKKICVFCGENCGNRPRVKDVRGHYACKRCVREQAVTRTSIGTGNAFVNADATDRASGHLSNEDFGLGDGQVGYSVDDLLCDLPVAKSNPCPECGRVREGDALVCVHCGYNSATARTITTHIGDTKVKRERRRLPISRGWLLVIIGLAVMLGLPAMAWFWEDAALPVWILAAFWCALSILIMIARAFHENGFMRSIAPMLQPNIRIMNIYLFPRKSYYNATFLTLWHLNFVMSVLAVVAMSAIITTLYPDTLEEIMRYFER